MGFLSEYKRPPGAYAFHTTSCENVEPILESGVVRQDSDSPGNKDINAVLSEQGFTDPFPFDRSDVIYCHVDATYVEDTQKSLQEHGFNSDEVVIVVSVGAIDAPMYLADMSLVSDLIDYRHAGSGVMMHADTPEEAVQLYKESIVRVEGPDDIRADPSPERNHTELIIEGDIPPTAIADIRSAASE
jgi:hypothetical protein